MLGKFSTSKGKLFAIVRTIFHELNVEGKPSTNRTCSIQTSRINIKTGTYYGNIHLHETDNERKGRVYHFGQHRGVYQQGPSFGAYKRACGCGTNHPARYLPSLPCIGHVDCSGRHSCR